MPLTAGAAPQTDDNPHTYGCSSPKYQQHVETSDRTGGIVMSCIPGLHAGSVGRGGRAVQRGACMHLLSLAGMQ